MASGVLTAAVPRRFVQVLTARSRDKASGAGFKASAAGDFQVMAAFLVLVARGRGTANNFFRDHRGRGHGVKEQPSNRDGVSGFECAEARDHLVFLGFELGCGKYVDLQGRDPSVREPRRQCAQGDSGEWKKASVC